ncbi:MAG: chemotaxis response regulator protein-glutamate methylesterase [Deltaproteobacteria bacterium]|nr:chemotaxis response regulator protein-glutamate methylesterase [Deltaproteobacteria bacterium]
MAKHAAHSPLRALVVDDSAYLRRLLSDILNSIPGVKVAGTAFNGKEAITQALQINPDLITLDLEMPEMDGFTFLRWLMQEHPTPTIIISSEGTEENVLKALDLGAVDFIVKPTHHISTELEQIEGPLVEKVEGLKNLRIEKVKKQIETLRRRSPRIPVCETRPVDAPFDLVAIGASTGGPPALQSILSHLPGNFPVPIVVVQHMPASFTGLFAERLNAFCALEIKEAANGDRVRPGRALIAPGGRNMRFVKGKKGVRVQIDTPSPLDKYIPSVDVLMQSSAELFHKKTLGILLTGMGDDGKIGMRAIKEQKGRTIAESEETAVIFGMPAEAIREGVVDSVVALNQISESILSLCMESSL